MTGRCIQALCRRDATAVNVRAQVPGTNPTPRDWLPTYEEFGRFIDGLGSRQEPVFRFIIIALNTWARPEAITDLRVQDQIDFRNGLVDLNPPGRRQTDKQSSPNAPSMPSRRPQRTSSSGTPT